MDDEQEIDYSTPRNEGEKYVQRPIEEYGSDILKFCFTEFYRDEHTRQVIIEMKNFVKGIKYTQPRLRNV